MAAIKIKDAPNITPKSTYKIPVGNTEFDDARAITLADFKAWLADLNGGGGWSWLVITDKPNLVEVRNVATINGQSILGGGNIQVFATTIDWANVVGKPTIPENTSDLNNDSQFITLLFAQTYFQEKLVSGLNLATINGQSILDGGNIEVTGGGGVFTYENTEGTTTTEIGITNGDEEYPLTRDAVIGYRVFAQLSEGDDQETREYDITNLCYLSFSEDGHSIIANVGNNGDVSTMFPGKAFAGITYFAVFVRY